MVAIRETQATSNGFSGADKVVSLTTCQAGDTLLIAHATNTNPFPSDPTSTAGTLTQAATVTNGFAGRCRLRVYACPVASTGTKTVTFTGGSGGDIQGHALVIAGGVTVDGTPSTEDGVDGASASHVMPAITPAGAADLLVAFFAAFQTDVAGDYWTAGANLTERAESFDLNQLVLGTFTNQLSASGSTGTRSVAPATSDNRYVAIGIALAPDGITQAIAIAAETDSAQALGRLKMRALGVASEADAAQAFGRVKTRVLELAAETDAAQTLGRQKARALSIATTAETALSLGIRKTRALGVASETDTAITLGGSAVEEAGTLVASGRPGSTLTAAGTSPALTASGRP